MAAYEKIVKIDGTEWTFIAGEGVEQKYVEAFANQVAADKMNCKDATGNPVLHWGQGHKGKVMVKFDRIFHTVERTHKKVHGFELHD